MSKIIRMTPEMIADATRRFETKLKTLNCTDGKVSFSDTFTPTGEKATIWYTPDAYTKQVALIQEYSSEVAWHGVAHRIEDAEGFNYVISDILVYPQMVDGTNANTDQAEYETWMMNLDDDTYNNLRFQAHSHVRMGVSPSVVDLQHQHEIVQQLEGDMFYIFMIWNKDYKYNAKIYDMKINTLFEPDDISIGMIGAASTLTEFMEEAKRVVRPKKYNYQYSGANKGYTTAQTAQTKTATTTPASTAPQSSAGAKKEDASSGVPTRPKTCIGNGWQGAANYQNNHSDYDDQDNPYSGYPYYH